MQSLRNRLSKLILHNIRNPVLNLSQSQSSTTRRAISIGSVEELRRFSSNGNDDEAGMMNQNFLHNPPEPIRNLPTRGQRPINHQTPPLRFVGKNSATAERRRNHPSENNDFIEKFKLGFSVSKDNKRGKPQKRDPEPPSPPPPPKDADKIFKKMEQKTGLIPITVAMVDQLCKDGLFQEAMKLLGLMREKGTIPEVVIYTAVVDGYCQAHKFDDAIRIFRKMQSNGIAPNAYSYSVLIQGLYKCNKLEDAVEFCLEMLGAGHSLNVTTFVGLVDGFCKEKGVKEARMIIEQLKQQGYLINEEAVRGFLVKKATFSDRVWLAIFRN